MAFRAFTQIHIYEKQSSPKEKDKSSIQCLECCNQNVYIGTKNATVQHLILPSSTNGDPSPGQSKFREGRLRKLGSNNHVAQLRVVPLFNHLLVLWDRSVTALNMFSLEPVPTLKKIQHVSLFEVCDSLLAAQTACVEMVTSSSRRKVIQIHVVGVDRWDVVKEVPLLQDPVALAVDGASVCVATSDRYLLCDIRTGSSEELFPHNHSRQRVIVTSVGRGEFLLNGPESLGMFVMKTGICQRPPLQWPQEVLAAGVCFPYILTLEPQVLSVYSMVDQQIKQTVSLSGATGLLSTSDGVLVFTERDIFSLRLVPLDQQIQALVRHERIEEALLLLNGVQGHCPCDSYKELQKAITCLAGFVHFYREGFSEAKELFITGELDPREIIHLYPDMQSCLSEDFKSQLDQVNKGRDLQVLCQENRNTFHQYLAFLGDFLRAVRGTEQGLKCTQEVDCALLRLYLELGDTENLQQLVASPNECRLDHCVPVLEQHNRFFALGSLYQSHGHQLDAIETWVKIADGFHKDTSCSDVYGHIVWTLSQLQDRDAVLTFADWTLQRNQEIGVRIFNKRPPDGEFEAQNVLALLEKYPLALILHLEFLIHDLNSKEERHHNRLALAYVTQTLQEEEKADLRRTRGKLQQLLWESKCYDVSTVYERVKSAALHMEKAILLGRTGEHCKALQVLVHKEGDLQAAEAYCCRAAQGRDSQFRQTLLLTLLQIYLSSEALTSAAVDLLNNNPRVFVAEKIIQLLPDSWSIQLVSQFLVRSLRESFHQRQMARLQKALGQVECMRHKAIWQMQASNKKFRLDKGQKCKVCQRDLAEPQFAFNFHGELMHTSCTGYSSS
ncbi:transforming growth factor-beta receptor-associated protein 1 isoform X1 [Etheostoma spectabile]|uniref:transforming growth factor-beta receptor-associated protein 1 isoform X1 n=1 Tax=Etheostoma spectabile TaxID=54343 RepID=UPI0013AF4602|nr:transforming growth factor-beta receptor-associated protein 1-like isoform X1 [Etheostoma spectabile]